MNANLNLWSQVSEGALLNEVHMIVGYCIVNPFGGGITRAEASRLVIAATYLIAALYVQAQAPTRHHDERSSS